MRHGGPAQISAATREHNETESHRKSTTPIRADGSPLESRGSEPDIELGTHTLPVETH